MVLGPDLLGLAAGESGTDKPASFR